MDSIENWFLNKKKKDKTFLAWGVFLSLFPIYKGVGWLYIWFISYPNASYEGKVEAFHKEILFGIFGSDYPPGIVDDLIFFSLGLTAGLLLTMSVIHSFLIKRSIQLKDYLIRGGKITLWLINFLFTFWIVWGLM